MILVGVTVLGWMLLGFACFQMRRMTRWMDEREEYMQRMFKTAQMLATATAPRRFKTHRIDGVWKPGRFGPNGPHEFTPSDLGLQQIEAVMEILNGTQAIQDTLVGELMKDVGDFRAWELRHPCPGILEALK